jgi:hypothetical protein
VPQSLHRTWAALAIAALAVLVVLGLAGRDFVRNVHAPCPGKLVDATVAVQENEMELSSRDMRWAAMATEPVFLESVSTTSPFLPVTKGPTFHLVYDSKHLGLPKSAPAGGYGYPTEYKNVRVLWKEPGGDASCTCGAVPIALSGEAPSDLHLYRVPGTNRYVVKGRHTSSQAGDDDVRVIFTIEPVASHRIQGDRIFSRQHLPLGVVLFALGALVVALFRSRRAMSYALRIHGWTEARLMPGGLIESDTGATLGTIEQTRIRQVPPGPVLIAPEALSTAGLYRDVPIVARRNVAEGTHARWAAGTMLRLRDARALAAISTACTLLAFGARLIA